MNIQPTTTNNLLLTALFAAKEAGEAILEVYNSNFAVEHKNDKSPLTSVDKRSHEIIIHHLKKLKAPVNNNSFPILSEEGRDIHYDERKRWEYFWIVDPLDGTKEFIKRNGEFTVNIALIHKDRPVLGIIYIPVKKTLYFAASSLGAYKSENSEMLELINKKPGDDEKARILEDERKVRGLFNGIIEKSTKLPLNHSTNSLFTITGSRSHATKELEEFIETMRGKHGKVEFISAGSSLKFCLVAEGKADIYPRFGPTMEWDTAAGQAIVEQTGGKVLNMETNESLKYNKENLLNPWFVVQKNKNKDIGIATKPEKL